MRLVGFDSATRGSRPKHYSIVSPYVINPVGSEWIYSIKAMILLSQWNPEDIWDKYPWTENLSLQL